MIDSSFQIDAKLFSKCLSALLPIADTGGMLANIRISVTLKAHDPEPWICLTATDSVLLVEFWIKPENITYVPEHAAPYTRIVSEDVLKKDTVKCMIPELKRNSSKVTIETREHNLVIENTEFPFTQERYPVPPDLHSGIAAWMPPTPPKDEPSHSVNISTLSKLLKAMFPHNRNKPVKVENIKECTLYTMQSEHLETFGLIMHLTK